MIKLFFISILIAFLLIASAYAIRVFVCDKYPIPSHSMSPAIISGDHIIVNKLIFGARIYKNLDFIAGDSLETFRVKGFRKLRLDDIVVFNFPLNESWSKIDFKINYVYAKRIIGLPGDSVSVINGFYFNSSVQDTVGNIAAQREFSRMPDAMFPEGVLPTVPFDSTRYVWTIKAMGPLYIPRKGDDVEITSQNFVLYRLPIEYETNHRLHCVGGKVYLAGYPITHYTFKENYYFVAGDNVANSQDSRYFGYVPEEFIIGVVPRILYHRSRETGVFNWQRLWKKL